MSGRKRSISSKIVRNLSLPHRANGKCLRKSASQRETDDQTRGNLSTQFSDSGYGSSNLLGELKMFIA